MRVIKNNIKLIIAVLAATLIGGWASYFNIILSPQLEKIQSLKYQNKEKELRLSNLQYELSMFPEREKQLIDIKSQIESGKNKIPNYDMSVKMTMEMMQYMDMCNFQDLSINMGEPEKQEDSSNHYYKVPVMVRYITTYADTMDFLENIYRSYQIITLEYLSIDNSIQERIGPEENKVISADVITTELILWLYYTDNVEQKGMYPNFIEFAGGEDHVFLRPGVGEGIEEITE